MVITPHMLAGAGLGQMASTRKRAFLIGFISHFVLDRIPHTDYDISYRRILALDLTTMIYMLWLYRHHRSIFGAIGGITPDILVHGQEFFNFKIPVKDLHNLNHTQYRPKPLIGISTQVITALLALYLLKNGLKTPYITCPCLHSIKQKAIL
jgi:hypothetical protein